MYMYLSSILHVYTYTYIVRTSPPHGYTCDGFKSGLRIGFQYGSPRHPATSNMASAHPALA